MALDEEINLSTATSKLSMQGGVPPQRTPDYENEQIFQRNRLPARSYYIPDTSLLLNGTWDFSYVPTPTHAPSPPKLGQSDTETSSEATADPKIVWSSIEVPGHWQLQGYGRPHYTNVIYPFPVCPPHVPTETPTGTYRRSFSVPSHWPLDSQLRVRFDGVDSAFYIWINGLEVGYSQGSRNPAEFEITKYVKRNEENEIWVRVLQWCDGSYIEDQDQWWLSGIFRDVHLISFPTSHIEDFVLKTDLDENYEDAVLSMALTLQLQRTCHIAIQIQGPGNDNPLFVYEVMPVSAETSTVEKQLKISAPHKWTAETPTLYKVGISLLDDDKIAQYIPHKIGFRKVELKNGNITVNGTPIFFRGVNRHDHHPRLGRAVPPSFIYQDLLLMKQHNINAVRCSHYPPHPALLSMCDELGLWVMDEADVECHGFEQAVARAFDMPEDMNYDQRKALVSFEAAKFTSDNEDWKAAYLDRMTQLVQRDKNYTCIIIWSLGNESFYGQNHRAMYEYAKSFDPGRLVHYEGDVQAESADMFSYMYPSVAKLKDLAKQNTADDGSFEKPIILCEYAHAMGNGPGLLFDYHRAFDESRRLQGGFIWEWANHGLWKEDNQIYAYGGDFGDIPNDGAFVMDGLCNSEHKPTPGLLEVKAIFTPLTMDIVGDEFRGDMKIVNNYDFNELEGIAAHYRIESLQDRTILVDSGELKIPTVRPREAITFALPQKFLQYRSLADIWLLISYRLAKPVSWAEAGHEVTWCQFLLSSRDVRPQPTISEILPAPSELTIRGSKIQSFISGTDFTLTFDRTRGDLISWAFRGADLLSIGDTSPFHLSFWRPPTDNDARSAAPQWRRWGLDVLTTQLRSFEITRAGPSEIRVQVTTFIAPPILAWGFAVMSTYCVQGNGIMTVTYNVAPSDGAPATVPRIGVDVHLSDSITHSRWHGLGPGESYPDKYIAQRVGIYESSIDDLHTPYDIPQENGNHCDTKWVEMLTPEGIGLRVTKNHIPGWGFPWFNFGAGRYSAKELEQAGHQGELEPLDQTGKGVYWRVDYDVAGLGTGACGPGVKEEDQVVCEGGWDFEFVFQPLIGGQ